MEAYSVEKLAACLVVLKADELVAVMVWSKAGTTAVMLAE